MVSNLEELYAVLALLLLQKDVDVRSKGKKAVNVMVMDGQCCTIDLPRKITPTACIISEALQFSTSLHSLVSTCRKYVWGIILFEFGVVVWLHVCFSEVTPSHGSERRGK